MLLGFETIREIKDPIAPTTVPETDVEVDAARLEPRVEERDGYFVLREKFIEGINLAEKIKIEKDPLKLFTEGGIEELANMSRFVSQEEASIFMMRLKLPNGVTMSAQTRYLASVIRKYGEEGCVDVTTRQNWTCLQSGMDNVRNPVGNPLAGIDPEEIVDTRPYTNSSLPILMAIRPWPTSGRFGFNLLVGGFFSAKRCDEAIPLDAWVLADDVIPLCKAVLEAYRDLGFRGNRQKTRMMWLIDELGLEVFKSEVAKKMPQKELERASSQALVQKKWERRDYLGVHPKECLKKSL